MKEEIIGLFVPSVVFTFLTLKLNVPVHLTRDPKFWIIGLFLVNAYCLVVAQLVRFLGWKPFKYLWIFSVYLFVPFFMILFQRVGLPPVLAPFAAFSVGLAVEYTIFGDISFKIDLFRLTLLTLFVRGAVNLFECSGCR